MNSISPVLTESEVSSEHIVALGQDNYYPVVVARIVYPSGQIASLTRFRFSDRERAAIANGADLILSQPHHHAMMPIGLQFAMPNEYPMEDL